MAAYATNLQFAQRSGLGLRIVDENVGTGDASNDDFDLDHVNIISGSYTLSYAASGSNNFTALTETTHYTLDRESGRVLLTAAGITALGTNILYATYWYTDDFSDTVITDLITAADDEIDIITGRRWDTPTSVTEYINARSTSTYPTTDNPYMSDYDQPDIFMVEQYPVTQVDSVFFIAQPISISRFFNYDDGTATFTDITDDINTSTEAPVTLFNATPAVNDYVYIGSSLQFLGLDVNLSTLGTGTPAIDWEYWNGSAWADITETDTDTGASTFTASGEFTWTYPYGWAQNAVNGQTYYWIRGALTSGYTVAPVAATVTIRDSISVILEPREFQFESNGTVHLVGQRKSSGVRNIRVTYRYGYTTTPTYITDLSVLLASEKAFLNITGSSFDEATGYTLGSKSVQIGEAWVNVKQVLEEIRKRMERILESIGKRVKVTAI